MQIIFILNNLFPNGKASATRVRSYGKGFTKCKIKTKVLLPVPRQKYAKHYLNPNNKGIDNNGIEYKYMAGTSMRNRCFLIRQIQDIYGYTITLLYILLKSHKGDIYIIYEGSPIWYQLCITVAHIKKLKIGIELNEFPYATGIETNLAKFKRHIMLTKIFPKLDFILAISRELEKIGLKYAPQATTIKVPILSEGTQEPEENEKKIKLHTPYIFHSGTLSEQKDGICGMIEAFGIACQHIKGEIYFILTGNLQQSPHAKTIEQIIEKYQIKNRVIFIGYVDIPTLRTYQKNCFLTIINKYDTLQNKYCFSTKLSEYLFFSRPVITTTIGEANQYLKDGVNAYIVRPHDPQLIANKIIYAYEHLEETKKIGIKAHELVERDFNCTYQAQRIINMLNSLD